MQPSKIHFAGLELISSIHTAVTWEGVDFEMRSIKLVTINRNHECNIRIICCKLNEIINNKI